MEDNEILIRLKRRYSKDELVASMIKTQSQLRVENGVLKSERDELCYKINKILKLDNDVKSRFCQIQYVKNMKNEIKSLRDKNRKLKKENSKLLYNLITKNNFKK